MTRLNSQIAELTELLNLERSSNEDVTSDLATLPATLGTMTAERDQLAAQVAGFGTGDGGKDAEIAGLSADLEKERDISSDAAAQVALLNQQLSALRTQIGALEEALNASESKATESKTQVADLGRRLNVALAQRVQDLSRYRCRTSSAGCGRSSRAAPMCGLSATVSCSSPKSCSAPAKRRSRPKGRPNSPSSPKRSSSSRPRSRPM